MEAVKVKSAREAREEMARSIVDGFGFVDEVVNGVWAPDPLPHPFFRPQKDSEIEGEDARDFGCGISWPVPYEYEVAEAFWPTIMAPAMMDERGEQLYVDDYEVMVQLWRMWPFSGAEVVAVLSDTRVQLYEAERRIRMMRGVIAMLEEDVADRDETLERIRRIMGGQLPTDGSFDVSYVDGGELVRQINDGLDTVARDIHRRGQIDEARKVSVTIKAEPSENSAAMKIGYEVKVNLAKSDGAGVAYIDKSGKLMPPQVDAEQVMLPLNARG